MSWLNENWFKLGLLLTVLVVGGSFVYSSNYLPAESKAPSISDKVKTTQPEGGELKEEELRQQFKDYYDKLEVGLCTEAYYLHTISSKTKIPYSKFEVHCSITKKWERNFAINKIVYSETNRADVRYTYDYYGPNFESAAYQECRQSPYSSSDGCLELAGKKLDGTQEDIGTWYYEEGSWRRDF